MNAPELLACLGRLGEAFGAGPASRRLASDLVGVCERNSRYLSISEYESSIPFDSPVRARFVHYIYYRPELRRKGKLGLLFAGRALELMELAGFGPAPAGFLRDFVRSVEGTGMAFPYTIVSAEWGFSRPSVEKITVYFCFRNVSVRTAKLIAGTLGRGDWDYIHRAAGNMMFLGADFFRDGPRSFKIYAKFPFDGGAGLRPEEEGFLRRHRVEGAAHYVRVTRLYPGGRTREDEKTHFLLKKSSGSFLPPPGQRAALLKRIGAVGGRKNVVSMRRDGRFSEVYFL